MKKKRPTKRQRARYEIKAEKWRIKNATQRLIGKPASAVAIQQHGWRVVSSNSKTICGSYTQVEGIDNDK